MIEKLIKLFHGQLIIKIRGSELERFLNRCAVYGIKLQNSKRTDIDEMTAQISVSEFRRLSKIHRRTRCRIHIIKKSGAPFVINRYKYRFGLFIGLIAVIFTVLQLNTRIWIIKTDISGDTDCNALMNQVMAEGIHTGMKASDIDRDSLRLKIQSNMEDLSFFAANIDGCVLKIVSGEAAAAPDTPNKSSPRDIVALKDGVIEKQIVRRGTQKHAVGDAVIKGEILVDALVPPHQEWAKARLVTAKADIWALTKYKFNLIMPDKIAQRKSITSRKTYYSLIIGKTRVNLYKKQCPRRENCDRITLNRCVRLNEFLTIPVSLYSETLIEYSVKSEKINKKAVAAKCISSSKQRALSYISEGFIKNTETNIEQYDGLYEIVQTVWCCEQIGETVEDGRTQQEISSQNQEDEQQTDEESER